MAYLIAEAMLWRQGYALQSCRARVPACPVSAILLLKTYLRSGAFSCGGTWNTQK